MSSDISLGESTIAEQTSEADAATTVQEKVTPQPLFTAEQLKAIETMVDIRTNKIASNRLSETKVKYALSPQVAPQVKADAERIKDLEDKLRSMEKQAKSVKLQAALSQSLSQVGISDVKAQKLAIAALQAENLVDFTDEGAVFNTPEGALPLDMGIKQWSNEYQFLQPIKQISGAGSTAPQKADKASLHSASGVNLLRTLIK